MSSFLRGTFGWLIVALVMSFGLWATVAGQQNPDVSSFVAGIPVELRDRPPGLLATSTVLPVNVDVRAPLDAVPRLLPSSFQASIDLSGATAGVQEFPVRVEASDRRVRVENVTPGRVTVRLEAIKKKDVPVKLNILDTPPFGFVTKAEKATPDSVTVSGPESAVDQVAVAVVDVRVENVRSSIKQPMRPTAESAQGEVVRGVTTAPENVLVEVPIEQQLAYRTLPIAPQIAGSVALGYQIVGIVVDPTVVTVVGEPTLLEETSFLSTRPINVTGVTADVVTGGELALPNGISLVRRQTVTVRVYVSPVEANKVVRIVPQLKGLGDRLRADISPPTVDVTISGPMPTLNTLRPQDVMATVDLTGALTGTHSIKVATTAPTPVRIDNVTPQQVSVAIRSQ